MIFRQLFDAESSTFTYLLADEATRQGIIIDPVLDNFHRDSALVQELGLDLKYSIDTHVHADHITSAWLFKQHLGADIVISSHSHVRKADLYCGEGRRIEFGSRFVETRLTPGHTDGCMTLVLDDQSMAFTGDCLLVRGTGRTDFQQGDPVSMYRSISRKIFTLPDATLLWPAHDYSGRTVTSVLEEKTFNLRCGAGANEKDFVEYMNNLHLPHPDQIDQAVPANLQCGKTDDCQLIPDSSSWAPLHHTFAGIEEVDPDWVNENIDQVQIVDVREESEAMDSGGCIPGTINIPLSQLLSDAADLKPDQSVIVVCNSGILSAQGVVLLKRQGLDKVARMKGGLTAWAEKQYATT